jgi:hypothetical protein
MDTTTEVKATETKTEVQEPQKSPKGGNATRTERIRAQAAAKKQ